jgi:glutathione transport system permease protein
MSEHPAASAASAAAPSSGSRELSLHGLEIESRTQLGLVVRRFLHHRLAVGAIVVFVGICALAIFSSPVQLLGYRLPLVHVRLGPRVTAGTYLAAYDFKEVDPLAGEANPTYPASARPSYAHPFGRDPIGRDVFARVLEGTKQSLKVGLGVALISSLLGTALGAVAGFYGGWVDNLLMRFTDLVLTLPLLAVLLVLARFGDRVPVVGQTLSKRDATAVLLVLSLLLWTPVARLVRGVFLSLREKEFVEAARALGARDARIIVRHLLPNAIGPIIVRTTLVVATAILIESALSFLGLGIKAPATSLGLLIASAKDSFTFTPWEIWFPGLMILAICLCINFVGDGLRDALDPTGTRVRV